MLLAVLASCLHEVGGMQRDGHPIRKERHRRGWKQQQLADFAQIGLSTVERAERGEGISLESVQRLCNCLGKSPEQLGLLKTEYQTSQANTTEEENAMDENKRISIQKIGKVVERSLLFTSALGYEPFSQV